MAEIVVCMHQEHDAKDLNCATCGYSFTYLLFSFKDFTPFVESITKTIFESIKWKWDKKKVLHFLNLVVHEAVPNAVEHGILDIGLEEKRELLAKHANDYLGVIERKWQETGKPVTSSLCVNKTRILIGFHDGGKGFDPTLYKFDPKSIENILAPSGKGLFMLEQSGIEIRWNNKGNSMLCGIMGKLLE